MAQRRSAEGPELAVGPRLSRRTMLAGALSALVVRSAVAQSRQQLDFSAKLLEVQARIGGRIGVYVLDTASRSELHGNDQDRFAMCSTFKLPLAAAILARVDAEELSLDRSIAFGPEHLLPHSPVTAARVAERALDVRALCAAVVEVSDNCAANLLLSLIGGPAGLTQFLRSCGDDVTRLDRTEIELNTNLPDDPRDTTTPRAMAHSMEKLLTGRILSGSSRNQLIAWLIGSRTGLRRIRAGLPSNWQAGDKTGTGANGAVNDVAIIWPPGRGPIIATLYMSGSLLPTSTLEEAHAHIAAAIVATMSK